MAEQSGPSRRGIEILMAAFLAAFGGIAVVGSLWAGIDWGSEGPRSGFFPFYLGLIVLGASAVNLAAALRQPGGRLFASWGQLRQVLAVVLPTAVYVALIPSLGLYVSSFLLIPGFMIWFGRYGAIASVALAGVVVIAVYVTFEWWFLVPLPKGKLEDALGL